MVWYGMVWYGMVCMYVMYVCMYVCIYIYIMHISSPGAWLDHHEAQADRNRAFDLTQHLGRLGYGEVSWDFTLKNAGLKMGFHQPEW